MQLLTKELEAQFAKIGNQSDVQKCIGEDADGHNIFVPDPIVIAKYFNPTGAGYRYATEYDPQDQLFFGYAIITDGERGYFSLAELQEFKGYGGLGIERDLFFEPIRFTLLGIK